MPKIDVDTILHCNEFELHEWIVGALHTHNIEGQPKDADGDSFFSAIELTVEGELTEEDRKKLEDAANELILRIVLFDELIHKLAGYVG